MSAMVPNGINLVAVLYALVGFACQEVPVTGSYLRDVELIAPSPRADFNTVYYYPSYVKGEDPVEEFNRRRLHVDTAMFMNDDATGMMKRKRKALPSIARRYPKLRVPVPKLSEHERNYKKIRQSAGPPRYIRDDVEVFDIKPSSKITKRSNQSESANTRRKRMDDPKRYEESDPQIFAYERTDTPEVIARANARRHEAPQDSKYFQDTFQYQKSPLELEFGHLFESNDGWEERLAEIFGDGSHIASSRRGNDRHYVEQFERGSHGVGVFQKKVKWADKQGGFGEHYWDLNHIQPAETHDG